MRKRTAGVLLGIGRGALASGAARAAAGATLYQVNCARCQGAAGEADTAAGRALKTPSLLQRGLGEPDGAGKVVQAVRENAKHKPVSAQVGDENLAAIAEFVRTLAAGAGA
jgi:mono/diheme cytochrome c family protein